MEFISGFIVMIILTAISSLPVLIVLKFKTEYGNVIAWGLFFLCGLVYCVLKAICIEFDILSENTGGAIPILPLVVFWFVSRFGFKTNKS